MNPYKMVVAVANQKGGCAKTTTAVNLAAALAQGNRKFKIPPAKVLLIDLDPQGNCATSFGVEKKKIRKTAYDLLVNDSGEDLPLMEEYLLSPEDLTESMRKAWSKRMDSDRIPTDLGVQNLWLLPSDIHLSGAEIELSHRIGRETRLREALAPIIDDFDHIIIDTPPSLGLLSINALCAANWVFIPVQAEYYALEGFSMLMNSVKMIQKRINRNLKIFGVAMTMVDQRSKLSMHVCDEVQSKIPKKVFKTPIRRLAKVAEAAWTGAPTVILNKPSNSGAGAGSREYWSLTREYHLRVLEMRRSYGVKEHSRLLLEKQGRR
ncbi:MAG: Sporulation initiation inhibitor protein Soj [Methanobacteriota archaeon]|jgi:chromosome partitioning protein|nr:MAG: Sporulation initiation inhibitor protein Soj [Euryarchaeota archaeon]|tara:strand:- start:607 stop:1569 length:963 start_codon:yes stop_codon:yes gene_type:complete